MTRYLYILFCLKRRAPVEGNTSSHNCTPAEGGQRSYRWEHEGPGSDGIIYIYHCWWHICISKPASMVPSMHHCCRKYQYKAELLGVSRSGEYAGTGNGKVVLFHFIIIHIYSIHIYTYLFTQAYTHILTYTHTHTKTPK